MDVITTYHKGDMLFETQLGSHLLQVDVPASMGGKDRGPQSSEIFVASLSSCIAAQVADYCNESGLSTRDLTVDVMYEKAADPTRLADVKVKVNLPHADIAGQEEAIRDVAGRCPVHQTICALTGIDVEVGGKAT